MGWAADGIRCWDGRRRPGIWPKRRGHSFDSHEVIVSVSRALSFEVTSQSLHTPMYCPSRRVSG